MFEFKIGKAVLLTEQDGGFEDSDTARSVGCQSITCSSFSNGRQSMCLAIMVCAVCWEKVVIRNPLKILVGIFGEFCKGLSLFILFYYTIPSSLPIPPKNRENPHPRQRTGRLDCRAKSRLRFQQRRYRYRHRRKSPARIDA